MFNKDPNIKAMIPIADVIYRQINEITDEYDKQYPDHIILKVEMGDLRGPFTYIAYASKAVRGNSEALLKIMYSLCEKAARDLK